VSNSELMIVSGREFDYGQPFAAKPPIAPNS
jgi:hypothetical protein